MIKENRGRRIENPRSYRADSLIEVVVRLGLQSNYKTLINLQIFVCNSDFLEKWDTSKRIWSLQRFTYVMVLCF